MRLAPALLAIGGALLGGCSAPPQKAEAPRQVVQPVITQLYAPQPSIEKGEPGKICYGVENASKVWITPPLQELSAAVARCIEVRPNASTTYNLVAEGGDGKRASQEITLQVVAPKARIVNVNISTVEARPGETVSICYTVANARSVSIDPPGFRGGANSKGCVNHRPVKTTTYTIAATGSDGQSDREQVTVKVR
jgi:hypothetical protein